MNVRRPCERVFFAASALFALQRPRAFRKVRALLIRAAGVRVRSTAIFIDKGLRVLMPTNLLIDPFVSLGHDNHFWCFNKISIGRWTQSAKDLLVISGSHDVASFAPVVGPDQEVSIGPGCWLGARVTILGGTSLGAGCIVAAGAVVRGHFPPWSIIGGVPARVIKRRRPALQIVHPFGVYHPSDIDPEWESNCTCDTRP